MRRCRSATRLDSSRRKGGQNPKPAVAQPKIDPDEIVGSSPEVVREQAIRRLKKRRDFHAHLFVYVAVNLVLWGSGR